MPVDIERSASGQLANGKANPAKLGSKNSLQRRMILKREMDFG
jgi:hypothetical protein